MSRLELERRDYDLMLDVLGEEDVINSFVKEYIDGYLCDIISEVADNNIPIYHNDLWKNAEDIQEYIEQGIAEGIANTTSGVDLMNIFQVGYYVYFQQLLYENLQSMVYNMICDRLEEREFSCDDIEELEELIEAKAEHIDNDDTVDDIDEAVNEIIQELGLTV